jgi:hypothetical protein
MARASLSTVPSRRRPAQPDLARPLRRWLAPRLRELRRHSAVYTRRHRSDRYTKRYTTWAHTCLLLFHGLAQTTSLRQSYASFAACPAWLAISGLAQAPAQEGAAPVAGISFSQVAEANTRRRAGFLATLLQALVAEQRHQPPLVPGLDQLVLLDSTFLALSFKLAHWLPVRATTKHRGIKLQLQYDATADLPEYCWVSDLRHNDCTGGLDRCVLDQPERRVALRDRTLVMDLGYYSHRRFASLHAAGIHVISRVQPQALVTVRAVREVQQPLWAGAAGRITVTADAQVTVGSTNNRAGGQLVGWRRVTATVAPAAAAARSGATPQEYTLLTDRWDLTAHEVVQAYVWRWQIELFFRWLKSHLRLRHLVGYSENAVQLSVLLVCLVHLLCVLASQQLNQRRRTPSLLGLLRTVFAQLTPDALCLALDPRQLAFPGLAPLDSS